MINKCHYESIGDTHCDCPRHKRAKDPLKFTRDSIAKHDARKKLCPTFWGLGRNGQPCEENACNYWNINTSECDVAKFVNE